MASLEYLDEHGLIPGRSACVRDRAPDGTLTLEVDGTTVALAPGICQQMFVAAGGVAPPVRRRQRRRRVASTSVDEHRRPAGTLESGTVARRARSSCSSARIAVGIRHV